MTKMILILLTILGTSTGTYAATEVNGGASASLLIEVLNDNVVAALIEAKGATDEKPDQALVFKGLRQAPGIIGRCMGCAPTYRLIFEANPWVTKSKISECFIVVSGQPGAMKVDSDDCK